MKLLVPFLTLAFSLCFSCYSCKKSSGDQLPLKDAVVVDGGSIVVDGCGWLINVDAVTYSPTNLPSIWQKDGLPVKVSFFEFPAQRVCFGPALIPRMEIIEIKNR